MDLRDLRIFVEPQQGATYDTLLTVAQAAEALGFGAFFRSDHFLKMGSVDGLPGPTDAWITLAGLARETATIRLGTLVTSATFRYPGPLAIAVAQVDQMSGGRVELGLGAGWFEAEHQAYGLPFPGVAERFDRLEEQLELITRFWSAPVGSTVDLPGPYYPVVASPALPKPAAAPPIIIGGNGARRTPELTARYAAEFNLPFGSLDAFATQCQRVADACVAIDRDPSTVLTTAALIAVCGRDEAEFERRAAAVGREPAELRANGACGTIEEVASTLRTWSAAGAHRIYLQVLDLQDLDHLECIAEAAAS